MGSLPLDGPIGWLLLNFIVTVGFLAIYSFIPAQHRQSTLNLRWVILPYAALLTGRVSPRLMGITGIDWLLSFGFGLGLIAAVLGLLVLVRSTTDFSPPLNSLSEQWGGGRQLSNLLPATRINSSIAFSLAPLFNTAAEEFYWAFLRGALWESFLLTSLFGEQAGYWAVWLAALLALPEIFRFQSTLPNRLAKLILLLLTSVLFLYTQNFWLCWLLHVLVLLLLLP